MIQGVWFVLAISIEFTCSLGAHDWKIQEISPSNISTLFEGRWGAFIAKQNDSIFILGGAPRNETMLIQFNTITESFIYHSSNTWEYGRQEGQSSTQIGHELFMLPSQTHNISKLNLITLKTEDLTIFPGEARKGRCLTSVDSYLIVIGGLNAPYYDYYGSMFIYDTINNEWSNALPLPSPRAYHSCNIIDDTIYVFGGYANPAFFNDIWMLEIDDIEHCCSTGWIQLNAMSSPKENHRSIAVESNVYIIGGYTGSTLLSEVDVLNTKTNEISSYSDMNYAKEYHSAVELNSIIYVFCGWPYTGNEYYQYTNLSPSHSSKSNGNSTIWIILGIALSLLIIYGVYYVYSKWRREKHALIGNGLGAEGQIENRTEFI